jgi:RND family efflux transporter MFP subunit
MNRRSLVLAAAIATLALALAAAGCVAKRAAHAPDAAAPINVTTAAVRDSELSRPVVATGVLSADEEVPLSFKVGGVIATVSVEPGQSVRQGQRLAAIEQPEIGAVVEKARAAVEKAERDLTRAKALYADSVVSREQLDNATTARDVAQSDLEAARFNQRYAMIGAPGSGIVLRRLAEPGQLVAAGQPVVVFGSSGKGQRVRVGLADIDAARVAAGDPVDVTFAAGARHVRGRIERVGAAATPGTGTYEAVVRLDTPVGLGGAAIASGLAADVMIHPAHVTHVRVVPIEALLEGDGDAGVMWSPGPGDQATRHAVRIASFDASGVAVTAGLNGVREVITGGAAYLDETSRIRVANAGAAAPAAAGSR